MMKESKRQIAMENAKKREKEIFEKLSKDINAKNCLFCDSLNEKPIWEEEVYNKNGIKISLSNTKLLCKDQTILETMLALANTSMHVINNAVFYRMFSEDNDVDDSELAIYKNDFNELDKFINLVLIGSLSKIGKFECNDYQEIIESMHRLTSIRIIIETYKETIGGGVIHDNFIRRNKNTGNSMVFTRFCEDFFPLYNPKSKF